MEKENENNQQVIGDLERNLKKILQRFPKLGKPIETETFIDKDQKITAVYSVLERADHYELELWVEKYDYEKKPDVWIGVYFDDKDYFREYRRKLKEKEIKISSAGTKVPKDPRKIYLDIVEDNFYIGFYSIINSDVISSASSIMRAYLRFKRALSNISRDEYKEKEQIDTEAFGSATSRRNHEKFAREVLVKWNKRCPISKIQVKEILTASHIDAWANNKKERLNPYNGICLSANIDRLFDRHLISFDEAGRLCVSKMITEAEREKIGIRLGLKIDFPTQSRKFMLTHKKIFDRKNS